VRLSRIYRAWRTGNVGETRLSWIGSKYKNHMVADMKRSGFEPVFDKKTGYFKGVNIDTKSPDSPYHGMTNEEAKARITQKFGTKTYQIADGKLRVQAKSFLTQRKALRAISKEMGYNGVTTANRTRVLARYGAISFHPIQALDKKLNQTIADKYSNWRKSRDARIKNGVKPATLNDTGATLVEKDAQGNTVTTDAAGTTNGDLEPSKVEKTLKSIRESKTLKITGGAAAAVGLVCGAKMVADNLEDIKYDQVMKPLMRQGMDIVTIADQIMANSGDIDQETLGFIAKDFRGKDSTGKVTNWQQAASINANNGGSGGVDLDQDTKNLITQAAVPSWLAWTQNSVFNGLCSGIGSIVTGVVSLSIGIISGGIISTAVGAVVSEALTGRVIDKLTSFFTNGSIDYHPVGAQLGLQADYGVLLAANMQSLQFGGRVLNGTETASLRQEVIQNDSERFRHENIAYRLFDPVDRNTMLAKLIDARPSSSVSAITSVANTMASLPKTSFAYFSAAMSRKAYAAPAPAYNYGLPVVGFSISEQENPLVADPFENAETVAKILDGSSGSKYISMAKECFGLNLNKGSEGWGVSPDSDVSPSLYSKKSPRKAECDSTNDQTWLQVRFFIMDTATIESWSCLKGDSTGCTNSGGGGESSSASEQPTTTVNQDEVFQDSSKVDCAPSTRDLGIQDGYAEGKVVKIRICAVPTIKSSGQESNGGYGVTGANGDLVVNSRISASAYALGLAAQQPTNQTDSNGVQGLGTTLRATSGFRTNANQISLCPCDGLNVAKPGYSNHQMGLAIDFKFGGKGSSALCTERTRNPGEPMWAWLNKYGTKYGFRQYAKEAWHWDVLDDGGKTRCPSDGLGAGT
jgi:hypothetical protein